MEIIELDRFISQLSELYGGGEARQILKILLEDKYGSSLAKAPLLMSKIQKEELEKDIESLLQFQPVQYLVGKANFYGYFFQVNDQVLIPRAETEELVFQILNHLKKHPALSHPIKVLDIGTGSGCIPITLKLEHKLLELSAIDVSESALAIASANAKKYQTTIQFLLIDFTKEENWERLDQYDLIVSNPPYIPIQEKKLLGPNVLGKEPDLALFVTDEDPLLFYRLIAKFGQRHLKKGGYIFVEMNQYNAKEVANLFEDQGFANIEIIKDMSGADRILKVGGL